MINQVTNVYGIDTKKVGDWIKRNGMLILIVSFAAFAFGYNRAQAEVEMDCKYAKAVRLGNGAFRCERIL